MAIAMPAWRIDAVMRLGVVFIDSYEFHIPRMCESAHIARDEQVQEFRANTLDFFRSCLDAMSANNPYCSHVAKLMMWFDR